MAKKKKAKDAPKAESDGIKVVARNRKAFHNYEVLQRLECGIVLQGTEVKSLRDGNVSFADSYATIRDGELFLIGLTIAEYIQGNRFNHTPTSTRKLLVHKHQLKKLNGQVQQKGLTLVPLQVHWRRGLAKVEIGVVRGKAMHDKRHTLKDRETQRERQRALRRH